MSHNPRAQCDKQEGECRLARASGDAGARPERNLRGHIESHGGAVVLATTLSASRRSEVLALRPETLHSLFEKHGELLDKYWRDHVGFGIDVLTEAEAGYLLRAPSVDAIRTGMAEARGG